MWYVIYSLFHTTAIERRYLSDITGPGDWIKKLLVHIIFARLRTRKEKFDRILILVKYAVGLGLGLMFFMAFTRPSGYWGMSTEEQLSWKKPVLQMFIVVMSPWFYLWTGTRWLELKRKMSRETIADSGLKELAAEMVEIELLIKYISIALAVGAFIAFIL
jgi:hypothetical protein